MSEDATNSVTEMLEGHRQFLKSTFEFMRSLTSEFSDQMWRLVLWGGGELSFRSLPAVKLADFEGWVEDCITVAYVHGQQFVDGVLPRDIQVGPDGCEVIAVQVRWLDKSPQGPSIWCVDLKVLSEKDMTLGTALNNIAPLLQPADADLTSEPAAIERVATRVNGISVEATGRFFSVPVLDVENEVDIREKLVGPALALVSARSP